MKVFSFSPYTAFNPKDWNSLSSINYRFSHSPIKLQKKYFKTFRKIEYTEIINEVKDLPIQMQLSFS